MSTRIMHCKVYRYCNINVISQKKQKMKQSEQKEYKHIIYIYMYKLYLEPCTLTVHTHLSKLV